MKKYRNYIISFIAIVIFVILICFVPISASKLIPVIEKQIYDDYGINAHIEKLVMRLGPSLKLKTPIMHLTYDDGQKFAQLDSVKFYIPWTSVIKKSPCANSLYANKMVLRISSDDKYIKNLIERVNSKNFSELPDLHLKNYKLSYDDKDLSEIIVLSGYTTDIVKLKQYNSFKLNTTGDFYINDKQYINYDISILPKLNLEKINYENISLNFIKQIKDLDFHSDIIADLKIYSNSQNKIQSSGFINIDNISVLDKNQKNPKSFIYLTLLGDKASLLSNFYTAQNKKVYLEGMVNNSKKPIIDLKVRTDEISLEDLYQKLKIFTNMSFLKNIRKIDGNMIANFSLKGDLNKIKSTGYLKISDACIKADGLYINKINSDIDLSNNKISINNTTGMVNNSPIMLKGVVDKNIDLEFLMSKVELKYLLPESSGIKNGKMSLSANIGGTLDNITHKENLHAENILFEKNKNSVSVESIQYDTNKNNTAYLRNINIKTPETALIKIPSASPIIDNEKIVVPLINVFMTNSKLTVNGNITNYNNSNISFNTNVNGFIHSSDINRIKAYATIYPIKMVLSGNNVSQNLNTQILFEKTDIFDEPTVLNLNSKLEKDTLKIDDLSIHGFSGKFSDNFKLNTKGQKKITANGIIENLKSPVFKNFRIYTPSMLNISLPDSSAQLKGDLFINGQSKNPEIAGQVQIQNLYNQTMKLSLANCTADFNKNYTIVNAPLLKVADSAMGINATILNDISRAVIIKNLNIKSKALNTDTVLMYKDSPLMKMFPIEIQDGKFYSERIMSDIYGSPLYLTSFSGDLKLKNNILEIKNMASEIFNGKLSGALSFNMKDETFKSKVMARGVSAAPIFDIISSRKDTISGVMDFDFDLTGNLASKQSLNGDIKFIAKNGRMSTLGKLEHLLYAQNVVADNMLRTSLSVVMKAITLKDTGLFRVLRGEITMQNGAADIKFLQSQGPLMALFIKGIYYPETDMAKLIVLGRLSDEVVSGLGAFGDFSMRKLMVMLTGEDTKYNIAPADIQNLPQLPVKNTKEFRSVINGIIDKPSSVKIFNWISYSEKSLRQKDVPTSNVKVPSFVDELPY